MKGKRLLAMLLAVMMIVTALPVGIFAEEEQAEPSVEKNRLFFRYAGEDEDELLEEDVTNELETELSIPYESSAHVYFYYGTENNHALVKYTDLEVTGDAIAWNPPKASEMANPDDEGYLVGVRGEEFGEVTLTYKDASMQVTVSLPSRAFYSAPELSIENYIGKGTLPFNGKKVDENGNPCDIYYYLRTSSRPLVSIELEKNGEALTETDTGVTAELVDSQYAVITIREDFDPDGRYNIIEKREDGKENNLKFKIVDKRESASSGTIGYYEEKNGDADSSLGKGEGVITGAVGETVTAYLVWNPDECGELRDVLVSFRPSATGMLFEEKEMSEAADTLENYGVTLLLNEEDGYIQVQATIGESLNVGLIPVFAGAAQEEYWLSIDPEKGSSGEDDNEGDGEDLSDIFTSGAGLYWRNFKGIYNGEPVFKSTGARKFMNDEVGQDITAVFFFWDGETAVEIEPDQLVFPDKLKWEVSEDYANAVYMEFDTAMEEHIIHIKGDVTYQFRLSVEAPVGEVGMDSIAYFNAPKRMEEHWNKQELLTGLSEYVRSVYLMWDPELFELDDKADFKIYLEKNEVDGVELPATMWDDDVDTLLAEYGITLTLDAENALVQVDADFAEVNGTLDFTTFVTDKKGLEYEVQISIDLVDPVRKNENYAPALKWRPVVDLDDETFAEQGELRSFAQLTAMDYVCMALYEVDENGDMWPVSFEDKRLGTAGRFHLSSMDDENEHWMNVVSEGTTVGSVNIASSYGSKLMPRYKDSADIDEDAFNAVELLYALDIMLGDHLGNFNPDGRVTRAELAKIIYVILNYGEDDEGENWTGANIFSDVEEGSWYEGYVNYCAVNKLVQGVDGRFAPNESVTVAKAAKTILQAFYRHADREAYNDSENGTANILADAQEIGLLDGVNCSLNGDISRQWLAKMLENILLKCYTVQQSGNKYYEVPVGVRYFDLTNESIEYQTVYRAIPLDVVLPFAAFYTEPQRDGDYFAAYELQYEKQPYYVLVEDGWTVTAINSLKDNMEFFHWESVQTDDGDTAAKITFTEKPGDARYRIEAVAQNEQGEEQRLRITFTVLSEGEGELVWRWVKRDENGDLYAAPGDETSAISYPGDDFEMAFFLLEGDTEIPVSKRDLEFPDFVSTRWMEDDNEYFFEMEFDDYGSGFITYTRNGSIYQLPVECPAPRLNYYSKPEAEDKYNLDSMLMGFYGETKTAYLVWDPDDVGEIEKVTVYFKMSTSDEEVDGEELKEAEAVLAEHDIVLTPYLDKGYIQIDAGVGIDKNLELTLHYADGNSESAWLNIDNSFTAIINEWRRDQELPVITHKGVEYTFGIGRIEDSGKFDMFGAGGGFGASSSNKNSSLQETVYLGAMTDFETEQEAAAPAWVYDCISDVSFEIVDYINAHDLKDQEKSNLYINRVYQTPMAEMKMYTADIRSVKGGFAEALLHVRFTVTFPGQNPVECLVKKVVHFAYNLTITPDLSEIDTAEELNHLLSSGKVFETWIKEQDRKNGTTMYDDYRSNFAINWESTFELKLPAVTYDDIITVSLDNVEFEIIGSEDKTGKRTTMPGMHLVDNNYFFMQGIDFVAVPGKTQSYGGETFTCGILSGADNAEDYRSDIYKFHDCTFTGFDYGVRNTPDGYSCVGSNNIFTDCEVAYLIDCTGKQGGNANDSTEYSRFVNCGTAIRVKGLPEYLTPYDYRVYNCDFIGNDMDIDVSQEGRFYFIENYYGDPKHENGPVKEAGDVHKRPPRVRGRGYADVVVNPRWRDPVTLDGSNHSSNHLIVDTKHGLVNYMFNDDALGWSFDSSILNTDLSKQNEGVSLAMTNDEEETIGTWNLEGGAAQTQLLSLFADEPVADTFCPALDIDEQPDGSIKVTVDDSVLFSQRKVTLTIPCEFVLAAVTQNGSAVEAFTANGQVTFTVTAGGAYVISEALTEEVMEESFKTGGAPETNEGETVPEAEVEIGWFDFNAQDVTEDASFVQIGTSTQQTVQQVNPDAENLGAAEDAIVETEVITVQAVYQAPATAEPDEEIQITVLLVLYDSNGRMIAMKEQAAQQNEGTKVITVECDASLIDTAAVQVRAFVVSADGNMSPLAPVPFSQTLEIPAK